GTVPFSCGNFRAAMAIPGFEASIGSFTAEVIAQPEAFNDSIAVFHPTLTPAKTRTTFDGSHVSIELSFTNTDPGTRTAVVQARIYDTTSGQLLSFATKQYMIVVKGNGVYNIPAGATVSVPVQADMPPGASPDTVRIEATAELQPEFTG